MKSYKIRDGFEILLESNCCNKPFHEETDICSGCGEHAGVRCPECFGLGEVEVMVKESFASQRIEPRWGKYVCDKCNGKGVV